jgi:hypothetical protein
MLFSDRRTVVPSSGAVPMPRPTADLEVLVGPRERCYKKLLIGGPGSRFGRLRVVRWIRPPHQAPDIADG